MSSLNWVAISIAAVVGSVVGLLFSWVAKKLGWSNMFFKWYVLTPVCAIVTAGVVVAYQMYTAQPSGSSETYDEKVALAQSILDEGKDVTTASEEQLMGKCDELFSQEDPSLNDQYQSMKQSRPKYETANLCKNYAKVLVDQKKSRGSRRRR